MGSQEQKARRRLGVERDEMIKAAMSRGQIRSDEDLRKFLVANGMQPDKAKFNQWGSQGGYATYGPSWDPVWLNDFNTDERIPHMGPGETWYDPSVAGNWQQTPATQAARMSGFFKFWKDTPQGQSLAAQYGNNPIAAWYALRAKSSRPNAPDESWHSEGTFTGPNGQQQSNVIGTPFPQTPNSSSMAAHETQIGPSAMNQAPMQGFGSDDDGTAWDIATRTLKKRYGSNLAGMGGGY